MTTVTVTLQFASLPSLASFWKQMDPDQGYIIVVRHLTLRCQLSSEELELALNEFDATVLENRD